VKLKGKDGRAKSPFSCQSCKEKRGASNWPARKRSSHAKTALVKNRVAQRKKGFLVPGPRDCRRGEKEAPWVGRAHKLLFCTAVDEASRRYVSGNTSSQKESPTSGEKKLDPTRLTPRRRLGNKPYWEALQFFGVTYRRSGGEQVLRRRPWVWETASSGE